MDKGDDTSVKVAVRVRPQLAHEKIEMCQTCTTVLPEHFQIVLGKDKAFAFDYVYDSDTCQDHIYESCAGELIEGTFEGFNATILAYGQTGSGKTYTMGTSFDLCVDLEKVGIIPRAVEHLFRGIEERRRSALDEGKTPPEFKVNAQFMELYNEEVFDLLDTAREVDKSRKSHIKIHEDAQGGIYTIGLTTRPVNSLDDTIQCLKTGTLSRSTASTNMNAQSSRSHAVFTLHIRQQRVFAPPTESEDKDDSTLAPSGQSTMNELEMLTAKFNFVDLAGSERLKRTGATGDRAKEGISINCGLLALGNVISALGDSEKRGCHVPYRDSKLTRLLQDSLGGNSRTKMIACVSPSDRDFMETLNTLKYANRARNIRNVVVVNQDLASRQLNVMRSEIEGLRRELSDYRMGKRVADGECMGDLARENALLQADNTSLRQKVSSLRETVDTLTNRNAQLQIEKDLTEASGSSSGVISDEKTKELLENYAMENAKLKSKLAESEAMLSTSQRPTTGDQMTTSRLFSRATLDGSLQSGMMSLTGSYMEPDPDEKAQHLLSEAKKEVQQMKSTQKNIMTASMTKSLMEESDQNGEREEDEDGELQVDDDDSDLENENEEDKLQENLADLTCEISIKQKLIEELELSQKRLKSLRASYEEKLNALENRIKQTEQERDKVISSLGSQSSESNKSKARADYDKKIGDMQNELKKLQAGKREHAKIMRNQTHYETQLKSLQSDLSELKRMKVRLMKQLQEEAAKSRQTEQKCRKEVLQLKKQQRMKDNQIQNLESEKKKKETILKRKLEEVEALRKQQQRRNMSSKAAGRVTRKGDDRVDAALNLEAEFDPRQLKGSWDNLEKLINSVVIKKQTLAHLDRDMTIWIKQREVVGKKLEKLHKKCEKFSQLPEKSEELMDLGSQIEGLQADMLYIQENIAECQNCIVHFEEMKEDEVDPSQIFVRSTLTEAMYLLDRCTNLAVNKGMLAAQKDDECRELVAKLHQLQLDAIFQRDMLQCLIQDKADVQVDNNVVVLDEDLENERSMMSVSPVDSLEDEAELRAVRQSRNEDILNDNVVPTSSNVEEVGADLASSMISSTSSDVALPRSPSRQPIKPKASPAVQRKPLVAGSTVKPAPSPCRVARSTSSGAAAAASTASGVGEPKECTPSKGFPLVSRAAITGHTKPVLSVYSTASHLYSAGKDRTARVWDLTTCKQTLLFNGHPNNVVSVRHSESTGLVFTASTYVIKVWDPRKGANCLNTLTSAGLLCDEVESQSCDQNQPISCPPGEANITDIALSPNAGVALYAAAGNTVRLWDIRMFRCVGKLYGGNQAAITSLAVGSVPVGVASSQNNSCIVTGSKDNSIKVFHVQRDSCAGVLSPRSTLEPSHADAIQSLCITGSTLYTGSRDTCIKKWDLAESQLRQSIKTAHRDWISGLAVLSSSSSVQPLLLSTCRTGVLKAWTLDSSAFVGEVQAHAAPINAVCTAPSGQVFTASGDKTIKIWTTISAEDLSPTR